MAGNLEDRRWWPVRNNSGEEIPPHAVMKISGEETIGGRTRFIVTKPNTSFSRRGYLINSPFRIPINGTNGSGTFDASYALCNSGASPVRDEWWGAKQGQWSLYQHRPGFRILGNYQGSGSTQRAIAEPFEVAKLFGVIATSSLTFGGSTSLTVYFRDGATWTASEFTITVYDRLLITGQSIAVGKWAVADWYCDRWWATAAQCPG